MKSKFLTCIFLFTLLIPGFMLSAQTTGKIPPVYFLRPADQEFANYWDGAILRIITAMPDTIRPQRYICKECPADGSLPQPWLLAERTADRNAPGLFAASGIILAVHPDNPVSGISVRNLKRILNGTLGTWNDGETKTPIHFYLLESHDILPNVSKQFRLIDKDAATLLAKAQDDKDALLILPLSRVMLKKFKLLAVEGVAPSMETILANKYPLSRMFRLNCSDAANPVLRHVESALRSKEEAALLFRAGLIPLSQASEFAAPSPATEKR